MHVRRDRRHQRRMVLASLAAAATGVVLAAAPNALASGSVDVTSTSTQAAAGTGSLAYNIAVRADSGDGLALATLLDQAGYDVISRDGAVVHVLGSTSTQSRLQAIS